MSSCQRQGEPEGAALADLAFDADIAAMRFNGQPAEGEPKPAAMLLVFLRRHLAEFVENPLLKLLRYSGAVIGNRYTRLSVAG